MSTMTRHIGSFLLALIAISCIGCVARGPEFDAPAELVRQDAIFAGQTVQWAGQVIAVRNLPRTTELEVLSYPKDYRGIPKLNRPSQGRFVAITEQFLEPLEFRPGTMVTIDGLIRGEHELKAAQGVMKVPLLQVQSLRRWSGHTGRSGNVQIGVGVGVRL